LLLDALSLFFSKRLSLAQFLLAGIFARLLGGFYGPLTRLYQLGQVAGFLAADSPLLIHIKYLAAFVCHLSFCRDVTWEVIGR
jgi:hypothetical protein